MTEDIKIKVLNRNLEFIGEKKYNLLELLINAGVNIYANCGGKGICGKCKIKIIEGNYMTDFSYFISKEEQKEKFVLACKTFPLESLIIEIPEESQIKDSQYKAVKDITIYSEIEEENFKKIMEKILLDKTPLVEILDFKLTMPSIENALSDADRLITSIKNQKGESKVVIDNIHVLYKLPSFLRKNNWKGQVLLAEKFLDDEVVLEITDILNNQQTYYGLVIDIGTTTIAMSLVDIKNFENIITKTTFNKQLVYGEDVITRIIYSEKKGGLKELHEKVISTLNDLINDIIENTKILQRDIYVAVVSGNTTMIHFFFNIEAENIRKEPYIPVSTVLPPIEAKEINLLINPQAKVYSVPSVASYVGGDIVAGVVACGIDISEDLCVLIDLGTNGEIVVGNKEFLVSAACSCGPAFEGVGISCGVRAIDGAIEDIKIVNGNVEYKTINNTKPTGICGSGLIDIPAELFKAGVIDRSGKFLENVENHNLKKRIRINDFGEYEFIIESKEFTSINRDIVITQSDIHNILRSKGAIFHGLHTLLKYTNLKFNDIKRFFLSGGFGSFLNIKKAQILGLLPDIDETKFLIAGNTSLLGSKLFLVSRKARKRMFEVAKKMTYIDLSSLPIYMNEYTSTIFIPHTDFSLFPNVLKYLKEDNKG
ncbi:MAG: ASKHA domain-containing protein [Endomicrobiia bacterium]